MRSAWINCARRSPGIGDKRDPANLDVKVKVGWVKGQNHLYFLYEASDNYWDFARAGPAQRHLRAGDRRRSVGRAVHPPDASRSRSCAIRLDTHFLVPRRARPELSHLHARRRQGLGDGVGLRSRGSRICPTPTRRTSTTSSPAKAASSCWSSSSRRSTTPRPSRSRAVPSKLVEDKVIGMSWAVLDYDDEKAEQVRRLLEPVAQDHDVRQRVGSGGVPPDADREEPAQARRGRLVLPGDRARQNASSRSGIVS